MNDYNIINQIEPNKYLTVGEENPINLEASSWYFSDDIQEGIPHINPFVTFPAISGSRSSTLFNITAQQLGIKDVESGFGTSYETMFDGIEQKLLTDGPVVDDRINIRFTNIFNN